MKRPMIRGGAKSQAKSDPKSETQNLSVSPPDKSTNQSAPEIDWSVYDCAEKEELISYAQPELKRLLLRAVVNEDSEAAVEILRRASDVCEYLREPLKTPFTPPSNIHTK